jgi:RHS repeat-associated protein
MLSKKNFIFSFLLLVLSTPAWSQAPRPQPAVYADSAKNYVRSWTAVKPTTDAGQFTVTTPVTMARMQTVYYDGLGRPIQTVLKQGSLITDSLNPTSAAGAVDLISMQEYDAYGREPYQYLPTPAMATGNNAHVNNGFFKRDPFVQQHQFYSNTDPNINPIAGQGETYYYSHTKYEASPLNRVLESFAPGNNWVGTSHLAEKNSRRSVKSDQLFNTAVDDVRIWRVTDVANNWGTYQSAGAYQPGTLYKTITTDENGTGQVIEFTDKQGLLILKKVRITATADTGTGSGYIGWANTYYIYDDLNRLRCVIQPAGVNVIRSNFVLISSAVLNEQCFRYEYDERNRLIRKKIPGKGSEYMVYDNRDRLVMTQDAKMRAEHTNRWLVTLYDAINRPVETGIYTSGSSVSFEQHRAAAKAATGAYPFAVAPGSGWESLSKTGYDDYTGMPEASFLGSGFTTTWNHRLLPQSTSVYPYAVTPVQSLQIKGLVTWQQVRVLGTNQWISSVNIYDDKGRVIQVKSKNEHGGLDVVTTQYSWSGRVLVTVSKSDDLATAGKYFELVLLNTYDELGRVVKTEQLTNTNVDSIQNTTGYTTIAQTRYDALGNQRVAAIGSDPGNAAQPLERQVHDYTIRGWLLGVNRSELTANNNATGSYFAYDLGYDKTANISTRNYVAAQYNSNISGMIWESKGDGIRRKYDFTYDPASRLLRGVFTQNDAGTTWGSAQMNYSLYMGGTTSAGANQAYDLNGNILRMWRGGYVLGNTGTADIDQLFYTYATATNKLLKIRDTAVSIGNGKLGDFKDGENSDDDYAYDVNGSLIKDQNKGIDSIEYNYLNLPQRVVMKEGQGTISYSYDAGGGKRSKTVVEKDALIDSVTTDITTVTAYTGAGIYESKTYSNAVLNTRLGYTNRLQLIPTGYGRLRIAGSHDTTKLVRDYFLKDHLGNIRAVLTDQRQTDAYVAATMEEASAGVEEALYYNLVETRSNKPAGYPSTAGTKVAKVGGGTAEPVIGPGKLLKVMAGDKVHLTATSWWQSTATPVQSLSPLTPLVDLLLAAIPGGSGGKIEAGQVTGGLLSAPVTSFINARNPNTTGKPKAYVNWVLFNEQLQYVAEGSGAEVVGAGGVLTTHVKSNLVMPKNGYLYVYVSNATENIPVYFDNLQVTHERGPLLEETHYYPYGLEMRGISSKALGFSKVDNNIKYQSQEFSSGEFSDKIGLDMYEFRWRMHDPQIGRFWQIDPLSEKYVHNSIYAFSENKVTGHIELEGLESVSANNIRSPLLRALLRDETVKAGDKFRNHVGNSGSLSVSIGVGLGLNLGTKEGGINLGLSGPSLSLKVNSKREVRGSASALNAVASISSKDANGEVGFALLSTEFSGNGIESSILSAGANIEGIVSSETKRGNLTFNRELNADGDFKVGGHLGVVGVEAIANTKEAVNSVTSFVAFMYQTFVEYVKENAHFKLGGYIGSQPE